MSETRLSDKGIAVFAFAAYHQLTSGEAVTQVVLADGDGHSADPDAVRELEGAGLVTAADGRATFTGSGLATLATVIASLRTLSR